MLGQETKKGPGKVGPLGQEGRTVVVGVAKGWGKT